MNLDELIAAVPVHEQDGRPFYVDLSEIPQPWREQFWNGLYCATAPVIEGVERAAYAWDWESWVCGNWYGGSSKPEGLEPSPLYKLYLLADFPVLAALASERTRATRLDGRTCQHLYKQAMARIDWQAVSASELALMKSLGIERLILVIDFEATCDEDGSIPPEQMEIIEIGAVWATAEGKVLDEFQTFVRPLLRPHLTPFCRQLTSIQQSDVDAAEMFPSAAVALSQFAQRHQGRSATWGSWGQYDAKQLARDCERHGITDPLAAFQHINLKRQFAERKFTKIRKFREVGMAKALQLVGLPLDGAHHRGIDDARNIVKLLPWI
jgi:inhibitor of KinA sporulation pathway (predicted exonuclease)